MMNGQYKSQLKMRSIPKEVGKNTINLRDHHNPLWSKELEEWNLLLIYLKKA